MDAMDDMDLCGQHGRQGHTETSLGDVAPIVHSWSY